MLPFANDLILFSQMIAASKLKLMLHAICDRGLRVKLGRSLAFIGSNKKTCNYITVCCKQRSKTGAS